MSEITCKNDSAATQQILTGHRLRCTECFGLLGQAGPADQDPGILLACSKCDATYHVGCAKDVCLRHDCSGALHSMAVGPPGPVDTWERVPVSRPGPVHALSDRPLGLSHGLLVTDNGTISRVKFRNNSGQVRFLPAHPGPDWLATRWIIGNGETGQPTAGSFRLSPRGESTLELTLARVRPPGRRAVLRFGPDSTVEVEPESEGRLLPSVVASGVVGFWYAWAAATKLAGLSSYSEAMLALRFGILALVLYVATPGRFIRGWHTLIGWFRRFGGRVRHQPYDPRFDRVIWRRWLTGVLYGFGSAGILLLLHQLVLWPLLCELVSVLFGVPSGLLSILVFLSVQVAWVLTGVWWWNDYGDPWTCRRLVAVISNLSNRIKSHRKIR